jgi:hypothetical protein
MKLLWLLSVSIPLCAATYQADSTNYTTQLTLLRPGDTLMLASGTYPLLKLRALNGAPSAWITISGPSSGSPAIITAISASYNTVEITNCSYLAIKNLTIDSKGILGVFGISAKGTGNITHHILIENNLLIGQNGNQMTDGVSTKTPTWGWIIRHNTILGAGTGMYLGDSNGTQPFVAGLIENNLIKDTIGYSLQIKHQYSRPTVGGMPTGPSRTIIRNNVFIRNDQPSPYEDEPNLMLGGFPGSGAGSSDLYEVYGNFFYHNPREALLQAEGRVSIHDNVFVDSHFPAVVLRKTRLPLSVAHVYNNTIYSANGGIKFGTAATVADAVTGNLVFSGTTPISGPIVHLSNNTVDTFANAANYVNAPSFTLGAMDFYPLAGQAQGAALDLSLFNSETDSALDFNGNAKNAVKQALVFRGAYAGEGANAGWKLQAGIKPAATSLTAPAVLQSLLCAPATVNVGQAASCTLTLATPVGSPSAIAIASSSSAVTVPASVTVAAGALVTTFAATSVAPGSATITGTLNSGLSSAVVTVVQNVTLISSLTCSASTISAGGSSTCTVTLSRAPASSTAVLLSTNNAYAAVPPSVTVAAGATSATFTATTAVAAPQQNVVLTATLSGSVASAALTINPAVLSSLSLSPASVASGVASIATVSLNAPAPSSGAVVTLRSSNASAVVPASVTVPAGATSAMFTITTTNVAVATSVTVSAAWGGVTRTSILTVNPVALSALSALTLSPATLVGSVTSTSNRVHLNVPAPSSGVVVNLSSSNAAATVPASVTVPAGAKSATFNITTINLAAGTNVTISAVNGGVAKSATLSLIPLAVSSLTVYPALVGGLASASNTVYLNRPAPSTGAVVTLSSPDTSVAVPASVTVPPGATSASFTATTTNVAAARTVTISAALGGVTKTGTLTVNPVGLSFVALSPAALVGGKASRSNVVYLDGPAPSSGAAVTLRSSNTVAVVPASVTVPAGARSALFSITTIDVAAATSVSISAAYGGVTKAATLTVK